MTTRQYDHHDIGSMRDKLITMRNAALGPEKFDAHLSVVLSHVIAILHQYDQDIIKNNLEGDPVPAPFLGQTGLVDDQGRIVQVDENDD